MVLTLVRRWFPQTLAVIQTWVRVVLHNFLILQLIEIRSEDVIKYSNCDGFESFAKTLILKLNVAQPHNTHLDGHKSKTDKSRRSLLNWDPHEMKIRNEIDAGLVGRIGGRSRWMERSWICCVACLRTNKMKHVSSELLVGCSVKWPEWLRRNSCQQPCRHLGGVGKTNNGNILDHGIIAIIN